MTLFLHQSDQFVTDFCTVITENSKLHYDYTKNCTACDHRKLHCDYRSRKFYHDIVFPPIRSVVTDFCTVITENSKLHCDYRKLHCCLGLTTLEY